MSSNEPGCCGVAACQGCAWECTRDDGHKYVPSAVINGVQTFVCDWCGNVTPRLGSERPTSADRDLVRALRVAAAEETVAAALRARFASVAQTRDLVGDLREWFIDEVSTASVAALSAAGRLLPEGGEERTEWRVIYEYVDGSRSAELPFADEESARHYASPRIRDVVAAAELSHRSVTDFPDGSSYIGPWVPATPREGE